MHAELATFFFFIVCIGIAYCVGFDIGTTMERRWWESRCVTLRSKSQDEEAA